MIQAAEGSSNEVVSLTFSVSLLHDVMCRVRDSKALEPVAVSCG